MKRILAILVIIFTVLNSFSQNKWGDVIQLSGADKVEVYDFAELPSSDILIIGTFSGEFQGISSRGGNDIFISYYSSQKEHQWTKTIGSSNNELIPLVEVADNRIYIFGAFLGECFFPDGQSIISDGSFDVLMAEFDYQGTQLNYGNFLHSTGFELLYDIELVENDNVLVTGLFADGAEILSSGVTLQGDTRDIFLVKLSPNNEIIWNKTFSTSSAQSWFSGLLFYEGDYYINGKFNEDLTLDLGVYTSNTADSKDMFLFKVDQNGDGLWFRRSYGDINEVPGNLAGDPYGNVYFSGYSESSQVSIDSTQGSVSQTTIRNRGDFDLFMVKYNKSGNLQWFKSYGGTSREYAVGLDYSKNLLYMSGYYTDVMEIGDDILTTSGSDDRNGFVTALNTQGKIIRSFSLGNETGNETTNVVMGKQGSSDVYLGGRFNSDYLDIGPTTLMNSHPDTNDSFVAEVTMPFTATFTKEQHISCAGATDGELIVTPYFGTAPYTYAWSHDGGLADSTASNLPGGTYSVTITDGNSETATAEIDLSSPQAILFSPDITQVTTCSYSEQGAINLNVTGGTAPYTYFWEATDGGYGVEFTAEDQTGLRKGTYNVTLTDANDCTADTSIVITGPEPVAFYNSTVTPYNSSTDMGAIDLELIGGTGTPANYTASWTGPNGFTASTQDITDLEAGDYTVEVTDQNSCVFDTTFTVVNNDIFYAFISDQKDACFGTNDGTATVDYHLPEGASTTNVTYLWSDPSGQTTQTATGLAGGQTYTVTVTDNDNSWTSEATVTINSLGYDLSGTLTGDNSVTCNGDADGYIDLELDVEGELPYSYNWSNGATSQDVSNLGPGQYTVTVTDANQCTFTSGTYDITEPDALTVATEVTDEILCYGELNGAVQANVGGGNGTVYTYQWNDPANQTTKKATGLEAGVYDVTVADIEGCQAIGSVTLEEPAAITMTAVIDPVDCTDENTGGIGLTINGGTKPYSFSWTTADGSGLDAFAQNQSGLSAGTYDLTLQDANGCIKDTSFTLANPDPIAITFTFTQDITCGGGSDGEIDITATGGTVATDYTYNWSTSDGTGLNTTVADQTGLTAGTYTVTVTDDNGCSAEASVALNEPETLAISLINQDNVSCNGLTDGAIDVDVTGGTIATEYVYNWSTSDGTAVVADAQGQVDLGPGTYDLTVTDDNGCTAEASYTITEPEAMGLTLVSSSDISCAGLQDGAITIEATGGTIASDYVYAWETTDGAGLEAAAQNQTGLAAGSYTVTVTDDNGCGISNTYTIAEPTALNVSLVEKTDLACSGDQDGSITLDITGGTVAGDYTYSWETSDGSGLEATVEDQTTLGPGTYDLTVTDDNGCTTTFTETITTPEPIAISLVGITDVTCYGKEDGSINLNVTGGTVVADYVVSWESTGGKGLIKTSIDQTSLSAGVYDVTVTDDNGCTATESYIVEQPGVLDFDAVTVTAETDVDVNDGSITAVALGGTTPYSYRLESASISYDETNSTGLFENLEPETYTLTLNDDNSCGPVIREVTVDAATKTAIINPEEDTPLQLYPNPADEELTVKYTAEETGTDAYLYIFNAAGEQFLSTHLFSLSASPITMQVDLTDYPAGLYLVKLVEGEKTFTTRLVIQ